MKKYVSLLLVLLVVAALSVSGCTMLGGNGGQTTTPTATTTPGTTEPTSTTEPTAAATATPSVSDTLSSLYSLGQLHSFEYRMTTSVEGESMTMNMKTEMLGKGTDPADGKTKDHMKVTTTMEIPGMGAQTSAVDFYLDPEAEGSEDNSGADYMTSDAALVSVGVETITVPAGTFTCTKYTVTEDGQTTTFWASPQAPLPVKYEGMSEGNTVTTELVSWS